MAIVIPSKHIYSKSFDPVIDNNIDKAEVQTAIPEIINDTGNVYNETVKSGFSYNETTQKDQQNGAVYGVSSVGTYSAIAYVELTPVYNTKTYVIPKNKNNYRILRILTGKDNNGQANIKYSLRGTIKIGNVTAEGAVIRNIDSSLTYANSIINISYNNVITTENTSFSLPDTNEEIKETYSVPETNATTNQPMSTATAKVLLENKDNSLFVTAKNNEENFTILNLTILAGLKIVKLSGKVNAKFGSISAPDFSGLYTPINGKYEEYIPTQVDISFYGDTIRLDLQDNTLTIGNGNKVFSFDGNELIQTTNTPNIESKYQGIINKWKNGKQTATISCPITDYYDENGGLIISSKKEKIRLYCVDVDMDDMPEHTLFELKTSQNLKLKEGMIFFIIDSGFEAVKIQVTRQDENTQTIIIKNIDFIENAYYTMYTDETFNNEYYFQYPLKFNIGDIVTPYIYTNKGDKPLSYNKDFTPKQFKVVGEKLINKQGGTQELTLQEV